MTSNHVAIPDADVPQAVDPVSRHAAGTYASGVSKAVSVWQAVPDAYPVLN